MESLKLPEIKHIKRLKTFKRVQSISFLIDTEEHNKKRLLK
jgi:hypothetical protein